MIKTFKHLRFMLVMLLATLGVNVAFGADPVTVSCASATATSSTGNTNKSSNGDYDVYFVRGGGGWSVNSGKGYQGKTDAIAVFELAESTDVTIILNNNGTSNRTFTMVAKPFTSLENGEEFLSILEYSNANAKKYADCVSSSKNLANLPTTSVFYNGAAATDCSLNNAQLGAASATTGDQTLNGSAANAEFELSTTLSAGVYAIGFSACSNSAISLAGFKFTPAGGSTAVCPSGLTIASKDDKTAFLEGDKIELSAKLTAGNGTISYQWYKNGAAITGATDKNYTVNACELEDAGSYTCKATKADCTDQVSAALELTVAEDPWKCYSLKSAPSLPTGAVITRNGETPAYDGSNGVTLSSNTDYLCFDFTEAEKYITGIKVTVKAGSKDAAKGFAYGFGDGICAASFTAADTKLNIATSFTEYEITSIPAETQVVAFRRVGTSTYINNICFSFADAPAVTKWNVTFDMQGATSAAIEAQSVKDGKKAVKPEDPEKTGYNFVKWVVASTEADYDFDAAVTADVALKAVWEEVQQYAVKYGDDKNLPGGPNVENGTEYTVTACEFEVPAGKLFRHWTVSGVDGITTAVPGDKFTMPANDVVLTAVYDYQYTVRFFDGATQLGENVVWNGETVEAPAPKKELNTFDGWENAEHNALDMTAAITASVDAYAKWTAFGEATSINIEQFVIDNTKDGDIKAALNGANFDFNLVSGDELDDLDNSKDYQNVAFRGLKLKHNGSYVVGKIPANTRVNIVLGQLVSAKVQIDGVDATPALVGGSGDADKSVKENYHNGNNYYDLPTGGILKVLCTQDSKTTVLKGIILSEIPALSDDATLKSLTVNGVAVAGFAASKLIYNVELPVGTVDVPTVVAEANDANAQEPVITDATELPGKTTIVVTAEDGTTTKTYEINFTVAKEQIALALGKYLVADIIPETAEALSGTSQYVAGLSANQYFYTVGDASAKDGAAGVPEVKTNTVVTIDGVEYTAFSYLKGNANKDVNGIPTSRAYKFIVPAGAEKYNLNIYGKGTYALIKDGGVEEIFGTTSAAKHTISVVPGTYYLYALAGSRNINAIELAEFEATCPTAVTISGTKTYTIGETISLTATQTGSNTPENVTYQWYKDEVAIDGATTATFEKVSTMEDAGVYTVKVAQATCDEVASGTYTIKVNPIAVTSVTAAVFGSDPYEMKAGDELVIEAIVAPANATYPAVTWKADSYYTTTDENPTTLTANKPKSAENVKVTVDGKDYTLGQVAIYFELKFESNGGSAVEDMKYYGSGITLPTPTHPSGAEFVAWYKDAEFTVKAANGGSSYSPKAHETVYAKWNFPAAEIPVITTQPAGATYAVGETVAPLTVVATVSEGTLSYQWYNGSTAIEGATAAEFTPEETGRYKVVVTNTLADHNPASATSNEAKVTIAHLQTDVTGSVTWDWAKSSESTLNDTYNNVVLADLIPETADFATTNLVISTNGKAYAVRDTKYAQVCSIKFHTTVAGFVTVKFSDTGSNNRSDSEEYYRYLYVNGQKTEYYSYGTSQSEHGLFTTGGIFVPAGDVELSFKKQGAASNCNVYVITFSTEMEEVATGREAGRMYTYCPAQNVAKGFFGNAEFFVPENFDGFYVNLMGVNELVAGRGYIMIPTASTVYAVFNGDAVDEAVDASADTHGMQGCLSGDLNDEGQMPIENSDDNIIVKNNHLYTAYYNYLTAGKAFMRLDIVKELNAEPENPAPRRRIGFAGNTATLLDEANGANAAEKMLIDGKVMILRGGKFFDATGRLVK